MAVVTGDVGPLVVGLAECKAALRLERDDEDAVLAGHIRTAMALCEAFIGQWLIERNGEQRLACDLAWQRLQASPVQQISGLFLAGEALATGWESDIGADGTGWVRLIGQIPMASTTATPVNLVARFRAGIGVDWNGVPEPLRAGIVRLVSHLFSHRDAADAGPPPAAVAALWRPWRRMQLG
ncbi:head-tail connector protein [Sandarakinorhabdus oryzae]|uniref:head-tail connector protein n=1 Tax=Sandarakinorhabdus oryzae TaxID=2675220 RepID=UPI0012E1FB14